MTTSCFRFANYPTPLRAIASERAGRYNREGDPATQYLADHPLGSWAEFLRWSPTTPATLPTVAVRLWILRVDLQPLVHITFDNAASFHIAPDRLVSDDDYSDCQDLADRLRAEKRPGMVVPSAALPGTQSVVLFGRYVMNSYAQRPLSGEYLPGTMLADHARPPEEILGLYRRRHSNHPALEAWQDGREYRLREPATFDFS